MKKHSNKAVVIVIIFPLCVNISNISGTSFSDIQIDGNLSDWDSSDFLGQRNGAGFALTWSEDNLYFYWNGTDFYNDIEGADIFLYFLHLMAVVIYQNHGTLLSIIYLLVLIMDFQLKIQTIMSL